MSLNSMHKTPFLHVCQEVQKRPKWGAALEYGLALPCQLFKVWDPPEDQLILTLAAFPAQQSLVSSLATSCFLLMSSLRIPAGLLRSREEKHAYVNCMFFCSVMNAGALCRQGRDIMKIGEVNYINVHLSAFFSSTLLP